MIILDTQLIFSTLGESCPLLTFKVYISKTSQHPPYFVLQENVHPKDKQKSSICIYQSTLEFL